MLFKFIFRAVAIALLIYSQAGVLVQANDQPSLTVKVENEAEAEELVQTIQTLTDSIEQEEQNLEPQSDEATPPPASPSMFESVKLLIQDNSDTILKSMLVLPVVAFVISDPTTAIKFVPCAAALCYVALTCPGGHSICPCSERWAQAATFCAGVNANLIHQMKTRLARWRQN